MTGWVIVYLPGSDIYEMLDDKPVQPRTLRQRLMHQGIKGLLAAVQMYWWLRT